MRDTVRFVGILINVAIGIVIVAIVAYHSAVYYGYLCIEVQKKNVDYELTVESVCLNGDQRAKYHHHVNCPAAELSIQEPAAVAAFRLFVQNHIIYRTLTLDSWRMQLAVWSVVVIAVWRGTSMCRTDHQTDLVLAAIRGGDHRHATAAAALEDRHDPRTFALEFRRHLAGSVAEESPHRSRQLPPPPPLPLPLPP